MCIFESDTVKSDCTMQEKYEIFKDLIPVNWVFSELFFVPQTINLKKNVNQLLKILALCLEKHGTYCLKLSTNPLAKALLRRCLFSPGVSMVLMDSKTFHATDTIIPAFNTQSFPVLAR